MTDPDTVALSRTTARLGVVTTLAVAVPVLVAQFSGDVDGIVSRPTAWWIAYVLYVAVFVAEVEAWPRQWTPAADRAALAVMTVTGLVTVAASPGYGFSVVLPIVTACAAAFIVGFRPALVLGVLQALSIGLVLVVSDGDVGEAVLQAAVWAGFMGFAVLTVEAGAREGRARERLAAVNEELAAANERLERANAELEEAQRQLAVSSRNEERLRISRDLHDLMGHRLTALSLQLEAASHRGAGPATENLERTRAIVRDLLADVRGVVGRLRDGDAVDLAADLRRIASGVEGPQVHLDLGLPTEPLDRARGVAVLRVVQEALTNTVRHADADHVWIRVVEGPDGEVVVTVHDDGRGADGIAPGNGLVGMRERVVGVGGTMHTWTPPGEGFHLEAVVP